MSIMGSKLNDRQKQILVENGLSDDWSKLNYEQKKSIMAIEAMLSYLENKYDKKFYYAGYVSDMHWGTDEELLAYAEGEEDYQLKVKVGRYDNGGFYDNYETVLACEEYRNEILPKVTEILDGLDFIMYTQNPDTGEYGDKLIAVSTEIHLKASEIEDAKEQYEKIYDYLDSLDVGINRCKLFIVKDEFYNEEQERGYYEMFGEPDIEKGYLRRE